MTTKTIEGVSRYENVQELLNRDQRICWINPETPDKSTGSISVEISLPDK